MLFTKLTGFEVKTPMGDKKGKMTDFVFNGNTWKIKYVIISEGFLRKKHVGVKPEDIKVDERTSSLIIQPEVALIEVEMKGSSVDHLHFSTLKKNDVFTSDDEKTGGIYDVDIATKLKRWEIWKVLIKTGWTERRLRISPKEIESLGETIKLKVSKEDMDDLSKPALPKESGDS
jgi:sporulation protein YlmC with PRC-barrel domain